MRIYNFVKKHNLPKVLFVSYFVLVSIILYFLSCAFFGQKGLFHYMSLKEEMANQDMIKQELEEKMRIKRNMVEGMQLDSLDLDLLDEEARKSLGYSNKNEVVIYQENDKKHDR